MKSRARIENRADQKNKKLYPESALSGSWFDASPDDGSVALGQLPAVSATVSRARLEHLGRAVLLTWAVHKGAGTWSRALRPPGPRVHARTAHPRGRASKLVPCQPGSERGGERQERNQACKPQATQTHHGKRRTGQPTPRRTPLSLFLLNFAAHLRFLRFCLFVLFLSLSAPAPASAPNPAYLTSTSPCLILPRLAFALSLPTTPYEGSSSSEAFD